ncbi:MAG: radical SAM protein [Thermoprotei archaeon]|nr:MAG: radical SAM protein [Thermoprotei archaeon]
MEALSVLQETSSLCPVCLSLVPARIVTDGVKVYMEKACERHGYFKSLLWSNLNLYKRALRFSREGEPVKPHVEKVERGCPFDCGLCPLHKQHTCLAIIEVTDACNLLCPVCLAGSGPKPTWEPSLSELEEMLKELLRCEGKPTAVQFSGGEPTVRRDLPELVAAARDMGFKLLEVDTNGIELAKRPELAKELAEAGLEGVYLQFDGLTPDVYVKIRGVDLTNVKEKAIENCLKAGLTVTLATTVVKGVNDGQLWDIVRYSVSRRALGVNFQPFAALGRYPKDIFNPMDRATVSDVQLWIQEQSGGAVRALDFIPVPCPDPRCSSLVYACYRGGDVKVINRLADVEQLIDKYSLKNRFIEFDELLKAIAEELNVSSRDVRTFRPQAVGPPLRMLLEYLKPEGFFSIGCHFAQDAWTVDVNRLMKCCVHELRRGGTLVPFCLFNITSVKGEKLYRGKI